MKQKVLRLRKTYLARFRIPENLLQFCTIALSCVLLLHLIPKGELFSVVFHHPLPRISTTMHHNISLWVCLAHSSVGFLKIFFLCFKKIYVLILERVWERERERERDWNIDLLFYLLMHSLVDSFMSPDQGSNPQLCTLGPRSNQLSYPARATL